MPLECVIYASSAVRELTDADLESLLASARKRNEEHHVTGVLLFHDGSFFQYFEGLNEDVEHVYGHIKRSPLHHGIIELERAPIREREFPNWMMGFTQVTHSAILQLTNASWEGAVRDMGTRRTASDGMHLLMQFWRSRVRHA